MNVNPLQIPAPEVPRPVSARTAEPAVPVDPQPQPQEMPGIAQALDRLQGLLLRNSS
jgi:hypothetical protein